MNYFSQFINQREENDTLQGGRMLPQVKNEPIFINLWICGFSLSLTHLFLISLSNKVLLGLDHAAAHGGQPHHHPCGHHVLQG